MKKHEITKKYISYRTKPVNLSPNDERLFQHEYEKEIRSTYIKEIKNVNVINNIVRKKLNFFIDETFFGEPKIKKIFKEILKVFIRSNKGKNEIINNGIWIVDNKSNVYFHWICDALARYQNLPNKYKHYPVLIPKRIANDWVIESLDFLKIDYIVLEFNKKYMVDNLILTSHTAQTGNFNKHVIVPLANHFIKSAKIKNTESKPNLRIWISREKARRPLRNNREIQSLLKKYNFINCVAEELNWEEKVRLFNNAEIIAGTHGSGFTNLMFLKPGGKVLDLREPNDNRNQAFFSMSSEFQLNYYYLECEEFNSDYVVVDSVKLEEVFEKIL